MNLVGSVLFGAEDVVVPFVQSRIPYMSDGFGSCAALGVVRRGALIGGAVYHQYRPTDGDIMVSIAFDRPDWSFPSTLRTLFWFPFDQLGCQRMTAIIARENKKARAFIKGLGFTEEGTCRRAIARKHDAMVYGLLREDCRFLRHAKVNTTANPGT